MNANETLDYRPQLTFERKVDAPMPDAEVYENPDRNFSTPLSTFYRDRPSVTLEETLFLQEIMEEKIQDLSGDRDVRQYMEASPSLARQILYANINDIEGNTNVILYDRLEKIRKEIKDKLELFMQIYFQEENVEKTKEAEQKLIDLFISYESNQDFSKINYQVLSMDVRAFHLMKGYFMHLVEAVGAMMESNEALEYNVYPADKTLIPIHDFQHDRAVKDLLDGKQSMDVQIGNDNVGNKLRRLYNLRTKLVTIPSDLSEEQRKTHEQKIRFAEEEISEQMLTAEKDLFKAIESQSLCLAKFNQGFRNKCATLYDLKGGYRI